MDSNSKIKEALSWGAQELKSSSLSSQLDAEVLLGHALQLSKIELISRGDRAVGEGFTTYKDFLSRRTARESVAYIIGKKEFWGLDFIVTHDVLVPRPETETLVEWALEEMCRMAGAVSCPPRILDCGTGSGCIVISLAVEARRRGIDAEFYALDNSDAALRIAKQNALFHEVEINFFKSDWYSNIPADLRFDLIVSNPPYIAIGDSNLSPETALEPQIALFAGKEGLDSINVLIAEREKHLSKDGTLLLEVGHEHWRSLSTEFRTDLNGIKRVARFSFGSSPERVG